MLALLSNPGWEAQKAERPWQGRLAEHTGCDKSAKLTGGLWGSLRFRSLDVSVPDRLAAPVASDTECPEQPSIRADRGGNRIRHLVLCAPRNDGLLVSGSI